MEEQCGLTLDKTLESLRELARTAAAPGQEILQADQDQKGEQPLGQSDILRQQHVARVEPSATVTTRSKAFILDSVRLPEIRSSRTSAAYASTSTWRVRPIPDQVSKKIRSLMPLSLL